MDENLNLDAEQMARATPSRSSARPARRTVEPVSDFDSSGSIGTVSSLAEAGPPTELPKIKVRRRSAALSRDIPVGQYLKVPSSHHTIFAVNERKRRINTIVAAVAVVAVLAAVAFAVWHFMQGA